MLMTRRGGASFRDDGPAPRRDLSAVTLHRLDDEAWLLDRRGQRLFHLNAVAAFVWSACLAGFAEAEIVSMLEDRLGVRPAVSADYVATALAAWPDAEADAPNGAEPTPLVPLAESFATDSYRVLDADIRLGYATPDLRAMVHAGLGPLSVPGPAAEARDWQLSTDAGGFALAEGGRLVDRCERLDQVAPMIKVRLVYAALEASRDCCALHAAALGAGRRCLLLPGRSGAGKSTLAAGLAHSGFTLLGDDTAVIADGEPRVRAFPLPIALKAGAWRLLGDRVAGLGDLPIHWRQDGKAVRYVVPPAAALPAPGLPPLPVGWIVFPSFAAGARPWLAPLDAGVALKRLIAGFAPLGSGMTPAKLDRLIDWIRGVACFELRYGALDDAIGLLRTLCR